MNADSLKIELIDWIAGLKDYDSLQKVFLLKKTLTKTPKSERIFGSAAHLIEFVDDSFNDPIEDFKEYQK